LRIAFLLLHDFRFAGWSPKDFLSRYHFSKEFSKRLAKTHEISLYILHEGVSSQQTIHMDGYTLKIFPVQFQMPPFLPFGNTHNLNVINELSKYRPDLIHFNSYYLWSFPYIALWSLQKGIPLICHYHGACDFMRPLRRPFFGIYRSVNRYLVPLDDESVYLTKTMGINPKKIIRYPNTGVDTTLFRQIGDKATSPTLLYVGRMPPPSINLGEESPWLILMILSELVKERKDVKLYMIGDGPGLNYLKELASKKGLDRNVAFLGYIDHQLLPEYYSKSWLTFSPTKMNVVDPFWGGILKESFACGTPVVAFNDQVSTFEGSGQTCGYLIPTDSKISAKILSGIIDDRSALNRMGEAGKKTVVRSCSWDSVISKLNSIYLSAL
jgi:glycosyltransferase involved in cell wall biosynthesis